MKHATYVGTIDELRGKTALVIDDPRQCTNPPKDPVPLGYVIAQFDEHIMLDLPKGRVLLSHNWHAFPATSFRYDDEGVPRGESM
jgi:hypothetical protein